MKTINLVIDKKLDNSIIKNILCDVLKLSHANIITLKQSNSGIVLNGSHAKVCERVKLGDTLTINLQDTKSKNIEPIKMELDILYEDDDIIAVNKPGNMPTHPSQNHHYDTLANGIMYYYKDLDFTFRAITRLDRETSGIVVIAKNALCAKLLSEQIASKDFIKEYTAICHNIPKFSKGIINVPIKRADGSLVLRCVGENGKESITEYEVMQSKNNLSILKIFPKTGRTHQIRVHLAHIGCPIYGDDLYGSPIQNERTRLNCSKVSFVQPFTNERITINSLKPYDFFNL